MGLNHSPSIVTSGLVLALDPINGKSYNSKHNLAFYSQDWTTSTQAIVNVAITAANTIAPDGTLTGQRITTTANGTINDGFIQRLYAQSGKNIPTANSLITFSMYVKQGTSPKTTINLAPYNGLQYKDLLVTLNWSDLSITNVGTIYGRNYSGVIPAANGWYRLWVTTDNYFGANDLAWRIYTRDNNVNNVTGEYSYFWGSQVEYSNGPGPYIVTTTAPILPSNTWVDLSSTGNNGTLVNIPMYNSKQACFEFNGQTANSRNNTCDLPIQWPNDFTFEVTFLTFDKTPKQTILSNYNGNAGGLEVSGGVINFFLFNTLGGFTGIGNSFPVSNNTIYHVTGTKLGTSMNLYVNGSLISTGTLATITTPQTQNLRIGNDRAQLLYFNGNIYGVKIYNRCLTGDEISQNFNAIRGRYGL